MAGPPPAPEPTITSHPNITISAPPANVAPRPTSSARPRSTLNLRDITAPKPRALTPDLAPQPLPDKPVQIEELLKCWKTFAEQYRDRVAEYSVLNREIQFQGNEVIVRLANPFEEQLLQLLKADASTFLRRELFNSQITISGKLEVTAGKNLIYTNSEKFEHLLRKYPLLGKLRERFGLDAEY